MNVFPYTVIYRAGTDEVKILVGKHDRKRPGFGSSIAWPSGPDGSGALRDPAQTCSIAIHRARIMERMQARTIAELMHPVARLELAPPARAAAPPVDVAHDRPT